MSSLKPIWSINHAECNTLLQQRDLGVPGAYSPDKVGWARDTTYSGLSWIVAIMLVLALASAYVWLKPGTLTRHQRYSRYAAPIALGLASILLVLQLNADSNYVDVCKRLLSAASRTP